MKEQKYLFNTVNRSELVIPKFIERIGKNYVSYGVDNLYPQFINSLLHQSSIHRTSILSTLYAVVGEGLSFEDDVDNYLIKYANPNESWNDVFKKVAFDLITYGGFAVNVVWSNDGKTIAEFYHIDFANIRSGYMDENDYVSEYYYCTNWESTRKHKPVSYCSFNKEEAIDNPSQILYYFDYNPGASYYPVPSYSAGINDILIDNEISKFHLSNLQNSLAPSLIISLNNGIPSTMEEREEIYDNIAEAYAGTDNVGKFMLLFNRDKDHAAEITPLDAVNDDYYNVLNDRIVSRILTAHRISSPKLVGIYSDPSGFSSNADEIVVAYQLFQSTIAKPKQNSLLKVFNNLLLYKGYKDKELQIIPNKLVDSQKAANAIE